jgi:CRISPR/Cas system-associated exonuclease Cas4 (RecB family)
MTIALSWSRLSDYQQCPRKFHLKYIQKAFPQEEKSFHLIKGENIHRQLEAYLDAKKAGTTPDTERMTAYTPEVRETLPLIDRLMSQFQACYSEAQVAVTYDWKQTEWFAKDVAWRAIIDATFINPGHAFLIDWKSGKKYDYADEKGQLHLSGLIGMETIEVEHMDVAYVFVEHKHSSPIKLKRSQDAASLKAHFKEQFDIVNADKEFKPKVNENCKWCQAKKAQCPFSKKF